MSGRRLVLLAGLSAAFSLCTGCRGRHDAGASSHATNAHESLAAGPTSTPPTRPAATNQVNTPAPIKPAEPALGISPESFTLTADDPGLQLLAARNAGGASRDLTTKVQWTVEPEGLVELEPGGYLRSLAQGVVTVKAALEGQTATSRITIESGSARSWDFAEDIVPIFTRLGCNTGACHGKADGQNGFHLSLFGYDRAGDFRTLARDGASAGCRGWFLNKACCSPRRREWSRMAAAAD